MTPQKDFLIAAAIKAGARPALDALLESMATEPGLADPDNPILPFARFDRIHFARLLVLDDKSLADRAVYTDLDYFDPPPSLALLIVCDGAVQAQIDELIAIAGDGLRRLFSHCEGFAEGTDLRRWMAAHRVRSITFYMNWPGRTVVQSREEAVLHTVLREELAKLPPAEPHDTRQALREAVARRGVKLSPEAPTPLGQRLAGWFDLIFVPIVLLLLTPFIILALPFIAIMLRRRETTDPVIAPRPTVERIEMLSRCEDRDATNPFSAMGSLKPGRFRRWLSTFLLWVINWATHHITTRGKLSRVRTIHCARWIFLDNKRRLYFASDYDGTHEAYMDDFVNKVAFGLNLAFSHGVGYPHTDWLILRGARIENDYKAFLRHHELPTPVWYKAYPGLTCYDLARNARIRKGLEREGGDDAAVRAWLAEI